MTGLLDLLIIGSPYSGSTLLANALNGHRLIANAGELSACFPQFELGVQNPFCPLCAARRQPCKVWTPDFIESMRLAGPRRARALFRRAVGRPVVVDSSKFPEWLDVSWEASTLAKTVVVIISRNPFAYHVSNRRRVAAAPGTSAAEWAHCYASALKWVKAHRAGHYLIRYEDFAADPERVLAGLTEHVGLPWDPAMLRFWKNPMHALNGNAGAYMWYPEFERRAEFERPEDASVAQGYAERVFGGWSDEKWIGALDQREIEMMQAGKIGGRLRQLCAVLGYDVDFLVERAECSVRP